MICKAAVHSPSPFEGPYSGGILLTAYRVNQQNNQVNEYESIDDFNVSTQWEHGQKSIRVKNIGPLQGQESYVRR